MKILVVAVTVDMSNRSGDAVHLRNLLTRWTNDHEVSLVSATAPADCPDGLASCVDVTSSLPLVPPTISRFVMALAKTVKLRLDREYDLLYVRHDLLGMGTLGTLLAPSRRILEINGDLVEEHRLRGSLSNRQARAFLAYEKLILSLADCVICVSPRLAKRLAVRAIDEEDIFIVENGCDTTQFAPENQAKSELGWSESDFHVGFVGSLWDWTGLEQVIEAMIYVTAEQPRTRLVIVGDGPMRDQLERMVTELNLTENVQFVGSVPHDQVPTYMSAFDVGTVLKHPAIPGSPLKLSEYLACGTPVIATDDEDFVLLDQEDVGCRVRYDDPQDIADGICSLLGTDDDILTRARRVALNRSWDRVAAEALSTATNC